MFHFRAWTISTFFLEGLQSLHHEYKCIKIFLKSTIFHDTDNQIQSYFIGGQSILYHNGKVVCIVEKQCHLLIWEKVHPFVVGALEAMEYVIKAG